MRPLRLLHRGLLYFTTCALLSGLPALAQSPQPAPPTTPSTTDSAEPLVPPPQGEVMILQSHGEASANAGDTRHAGPQSPPAGEEAEADVTDAERSALLVTAYDLDLRLAPARGGLSMRARLTVRNIGAVPLKELPLQISSTLHWDSATLLDAGQRTRLALAQHSLDSDADHTGAENEAILPLPAPLAPGASASLDLFYSGTVVQSAGRLARLGANAAQQSHADWDGVSPRWTALRGFGNVLWYPVAAPQLFLPEGNILFQAVGRMRLAEKEAPIHLRLSVEYTGEPPVAAYFCGRRQPLKAVPDDPNAPIAASTGLATAEFAAEPLGFRTPSLFLVGRSELLLGGADDTSSSAAEANETSSSSTASSALASSQKESRPPVTGPATSTGSAAPSSSGPFLAVETDEGGAAEGLSGAANQVVPLLTEWLGPQPLSALTVIDHGGQPFEDGPFLVAPVSVLETSPEQRTLLESLTHAWVQTGQPWMDEGLARFFALLWTERQHGRDAAIAEMAELMQPVALAQPEPAAVVSRPESTPESKPGGDGRLQPLVSASEDIIYRDKAAAVWWMLRDLAGEAPLRAALSAWRTQAASSAPGAAQAVTFEHLLERLSGKDLGWFFADWVLHDRGLPDLTLADVQTTQTPAGPGHSTGWLVAVTVRNDGGATADVPLIVRSGSFSTTQRLRIPGASSVTKRVLVEASPTEVVLNDGGVPELRMALHSRALTLHAQ